MLQKSLLFAVFYCLPIPTINVEEDRSLTKADRDSIQEFANALEKSPLTAVERSLFSSVFKSEYAIQSGLIENIVGPLAMKRMVWRDCLEDEERLVFLLDAQIDPRLDLAMPLVAIVTDRELNLINWKLVAPRSAGFLSAKLDGHILTVTSCLNWVVGTGTYRYRLRNELFQAIDVKNDRAAPIGCKENAKRPTEDPRELTELLAQIRKIRVFQPSFEQRYGQHDADWDLHPETGDR